ncbi:hypothetical protein PYW08_011597 [Mythimna loreyi]|uniref:Uncharacterized protein n=1 Tax=Mythimna loreyi TaxID=667449 RepID=A0ACC2QLY3_9NEOP|nr:hypothetical protein PYW08_011597 [Mythimna loreyi]
MRLELPVCTRCCLCLPLRYGLIAWGYFRLVISALVMVGAEKSFSTMLGLTKTEPDTIYKVYAALLAFLMLFTLGDIIMNIAFVIGGHRKILKLLRAYYVYSFALWITTAVIGFGLSAYTVYWFNLQEIDEFRTWVLLVDMATYLAQILIQGFILLLIRSQMIKIKKSYEFRFINNAADCECTMHSEDEIVDEEKHDKCEDGTSITHGTVKDD